MKEYAVLIYYVVVSIACIVMMYFALDVAAPRQLNCGIAEISPDYSVADRQRCREQRIKQASQKHSL
jgi:hypothetical protein